MVTKAAVELQKKRGGIKVFRGNGWKAQDLLGHMGMRLSRAQVASGHGEWPHMGVTWWGSIGRAM